MSATATATKSRIAPMYYDTPPRTLPELPKTPAERRQVMADAVFSAVLALQGLLNDRDPHVVMKAAGMILDVDKTQMRHSGHVSGTADPSPLGPLPGMPDYDSPPASAPPTPAERERPAPLFPTPEKMARMSRVADADDEFDDFDDDEFADNPFDDTPPPKKANVADPLVAFIERMRQVLQEQADEKGTGEVVSWARAENVARQFLAYKERQRAAKSTTDSTARSSAGSGLSPRSPSGEKSPGSV